MLSSDATNIITAMIGNISDTLVAVLPLVLGLVAVLIGLFFGVRQIKKHIGKAK
jgi:F0F1-type ATP synthase assembly protein I